MVAEPLELERTGPTVEEDEELPSVPERRAPTACGCRVERSRSLLRAVANIGYEPLEREVRTHRRRCTGCASARVVVAGLLGVACGQAALNHWAGGARPWSEATQSSVGFVEAPKCCEARTARCLSCLERTSVDEYCSREDNLDVPGCFYRQGPQARLRSTLLLPMSNSCCIAAKAECFACKARISVDEFCKDAMNLGVAGCEAARAGQRAAVVADAIGSRTSIGGCCAARTAQCLACAAGQTVQTFCLEARHASVLGCASFCGLVEDGYDYPGGDLYTISFLPTAQACCAACRSEAGCSSWTWQKNLASRQYGRCTLKEQAQYRREPNLDCVSGLPGREPVQYQVRNRYGLCLDLGKHLSAAKCGGREASGQRWAYDPRTGLLRGPGEACLLAGAQGQVATAPCDADASVQHWDFTSSSGHLVGHGSCLDVSNLDYPEEERGIVTAACDKTLLSQQWGLWSTKALSDPDVAAAVQRADTVYVPTTRTRTTTATTTRTKTSTTSPPPPSLFCFSVMLPWGYEPGLLDLQHSQSISIFACEEWAVYTNADTNFTTWQPTKLSVDLRSVLGGKWHTFYNTEIFVAIWRQVVSDNRILYHTWTVKADPDAVFLPTRLRDSLSRYHWRLEEAERENGMFLNNCKFGLHGPLEIISSRAMQVYNASRSICESSPKRPPQEDVYLQKCLKHLGVKQLNDFKVLVEDHCDPPDGWMSCESSHAAFHPFKSVEDYHRCWANATQWWADRP